MLIYILVNITIILSSIAIDMLFNTIHQFRLSSILIALTINSVVDIIALEKYNFITYAIVTFISIWTILALLTDWKLKPIVFRTQKFVAFIVFTLISLSLFVINSTSESSYYMSVPYLSPVFFLIGASMIFLAIFNQTDPFNQQPKLPIKIQLHLMIGTILIALSIMVMMLLTPFWYIFIIIFSIFIAFVLWVKPFYV